MIFLRAYFITCNMCLYLSILFLFFFLHMDTSQKAMPKQYDNKIMGETGRKLSMTAKRKVIMHIGPHKTGSTHIHSYLYKISELLPNYQYCWPVRGSIQNSNMLAIHFISGRTVHNISVDWLTECLNKTDNIILSAEAFDRFTLGDFRNFYQFFPPNQFEFQIVIIYREWLNHMYSLYTEIHKYTTQGTSFSEYLLKNMDTLDQTPILNITRLVNSYSPIVGRQNIHVFDYYGILAAGRDEAYVLVCEIMGILCRESEYLNQKYSKENVRPDMIASELFQMVRNQAYLLGCKVFTERRDPLKDFITMYHQINITIPISSTSLKLLHPIADQRDLLVRRDFAKQLRYGNRSANLAMIRKISITEINKLAFFNDPQCLDWLSEEVQAQIRNKRFVNCTKSIVSQNELIYPRSHQHHRRRDHAASDLSTTTSPLTTATSHPRFSGNGEKRNVSQKILELRKKIAQSLGVNIS